MKLLSTNDSDGITFVPNIVLGPLLGIESDTRYSVCILVNSDKIAPILSVSGIDAVIDPEYQEQIIKKYKFYRYSFEFNPSNSLQENQFSYSILSNGQPLFADINVNQWSVKIPSRDAPPSLAFVSCNGFHSSYPLSIPPNNYSGWEKMNEVKPNYLFLTGDQVYADSIEDNPKTLDLSNLNLEEDKPKIEEFYVQLYIDSWNNKHMRLALATIPNIMTWDDHDIIDGYGSYEHDKQEDLRPIFNIAQKYYNLFQLRGAEHNSSLSQSEAGVFNQYINLQGFHCFLPDTRSNRTREQILSGAQYQWLRSFLKNPKLSFPGKGEEGEKILMILPVPIAHLDYYSLVDDVLGKAERKNGLLKTFADDSMDHWDHANHLPEQEKMLDIIFELGEAYKVKHLLIVSGDVHSAGASTVIKEYDNNSEARFATQLITSPMVNKPSIRALKYIARRGGLITKGICYILNNFGNLERWMITKRNFMVVRKGKKGYHSTIYIQGKANLWRILDPTKYHRNLNLFKGSKIDNATRNFLDEIYRKPNTKPNYSYK